MAVPDYFSDELAACVPEVWLTAFQLLGPTVGRLCENEKVLLHAGASGVATAAIQIAKKVLGASQVTCLVRSQLEDPPARDLQRGVWEYLTLRVKPHTPSGPKCPQCMYIMKCVLQESQIKSLLCVQKLA